MRAPSEGRGRYAPRICTHIQYLVILVGPFHVILDELDIADGFLQLQRVSFGGASTSHQVDRTFFAAIGAVMADIDVAASGGSSSAALVAAQTAGPATDWTDAIGI